LYFLKTQDQNGIAERIRIILTLLFYFIQGKY